MTAVTAGPGVILEGDPSAGVSGVRSSGPVASRPWGQHSSTFPPSATAAAACLALQRGTGNRYCMSAAIKHLINHPSSSLGRGQDLVMVFIHHFQPQPSFQRAIFPTLKYKSSSLYIGLACSLQAWVGHSIHAVPADSACLPQTLLAPAGKHAHALQLQWAS